MPARAAFSALIDLHGDPENTLTAAAVSQWADQPHHDRWGAFMYLHGGMRAIYARLGLRLEVDRAASMISTHPLAARVRRALGGDAAIAADEAVYVGRLLLYLGFYRDAGRLMDRDDPDELPLWRSYVRAVAARMPSPMRWQPDDLQRAVARYGDGDHVTFLAQLQLASHHTQVSADRDQAERAISAARGCAPAPAPGAGWEHDLATAQLGRYQAALHVLEGREQAAFAELRSALDRLAAATQEPATGGRCRDATHYLQRETARRICAYATMVATACGRHREALGFASGAFRLDPSCAMAALQLAEVHVRLGEPQRAHTMFWHAALFGLVERPYALLRCAQCASGGAREADVIEALSEDVFMDGALTAVALDLLDAAPDRADTRALTRRWLERRPTAVQPSRSAGRSPVPLTVSDIERLGAALPESRCDARSDIEASEVFSRLASFWQVVDTGQALPYWARQPSNAWEVIGAGGEPWFEELYFQSTQGPSVRDRLLWAALGDRRLAHEGPVFGETLASIEMASSESGLLVERVRAARRGDLGVLDLARLARVVGYLGFLDEALDIARIPWDKDDWDAADAFLVETHLLFRYIGRRTERYADDCDRAYRRMPEVPECLRIKLLLTIQCGGWCGKQRDVGRAVAWRERGSEMLRQLYGVSQLGDVERQLLTSRFWRFACFVPFLQGNRTALIEETQLYERLAREVRPESALALENMYASLETKARVRQSLGDLEGAVACLYELARDVDPLDSKVWLNIGDLHERRGALPDAVEAFRRSARLGPPLREVAWFRAGTCLQRLGQPEEAMRCHVRSLSSYPFGKSPLIELHRLAASVGLRQVEACTRSALDGLRRHAGLDSDLGRELQDLLELRELDSERVG